MTNDDFKKLLDEALEPIKERQESQSTDLVSITSDLANIKTKLDSHSAALISIESKLNAYGDMYKINEDHIKRLDKRLNIVEENQSIQPQEELSIP